MHSSSFSTLHAREGDRNRIEGGNFARWLGWRMNRRRESDSWPKIERFRTDFVFKRLLRGRLFRTKICRIFFFFKSLFYFFLEKIYDSCGESFFYGHCFAREKVDLKDSFFEFLSFEERDIMFFFLGSLLSRIFLFFVFMQSS